MNRAAYCSGRRWPGLGTHWITGMGKQWEEFSSVLEMAIQVRQVRQPILERLHMTTAPGICLGSPLDQGFVNFFSAHGSRLPENFSTQPQEYKCIVCYLLPWPTEKSNLRKSLSWLLQGEDVMAAGKWHGWSHWVHSQAAEDNECWVSVFRSHTGPFWGITSHFSLSGSIFVDTPKGMFP